MSFSVNTNITSLEAQNYLRQTSNFQNTTIQRVTSGLRIVQSGDDAAGLAIANGLRSDQAVLNQGIRNANDGLSTLQTIDGGMSNISTLLDRARTLATQSASGTFTGDRTVLNSEFQSVLGEINRQAQAIGLNSGGQFAQALSVFVGGGKSSGTTDAISNGSVGVDLRSSTVDAKSLGLMGVQASGAAGTDIGAGASGTRVQDILANTLNTGTEALNGNTDFFFSGPGFGDSNKVKVSVNLSGVTDANTLVTAINEAIQNAGNGTSQAATAFKNANITASASLDSTGKTQLAFSSSNAAFQVQAGDRVSNALLGNFEQNAVLTGTDITATANLSGIASTRTLTMKMDGSSTSTTVTLSSGSATASKADVVAALNANTTFSAVATASLDNNQVVIKSNTNSSSSAIQIVSTAGDLASQLGLSGTAAASAASTGADLTTSVTGGGAVVNVNNVIGAQHAGGTETLAAGHLDLQLQVGATTADTATLDLTAGGTYSLTDVAASVNRAIAGMADQAGLATASVVNNQIVLTATHPGQSVTVGAATTLADFNASTTSSSNLFATNDNITFRFEGAGLSSPVDIALNQTSVGITKVSDVLADLQSKVAANSTLAAAGITVTTGSAGDNLVFQDSKGQQFKVSVDGDSQNKLGMGAFVADTAHANAFSYSSLTGSVFTPTFVPQSFGASSSLEISLNGGASSGSNQISVNLKNQNAAIASSANIDSTADIGTAGAGDLAVSLDGAEIDMAGIVAAGNKLGDVVASINALGNGLTASIQGSGTAAKLVLGATATGDHTITVLGAGATTPSTAATLTALGLAVGQTGTGYTTDEIGADAAAQINAAIARSTSLTSAGLQADYSVTAAGGKLTLASSNGTEFRVQGFGATDLGFGNGGSTFAGTTSAVPAISSSVDSQGAAASSALTYAGIQYGGDAQTVSITANDTSGNKHSIGIKLENDATAETGGTIDDAVRNINLQLQQSNDTTLNQIVAVKEAGSDGSQQIRFLSMVPSFQVSLGATPGGGGLTLPTTDVGNVDTAQTLGTGSTASISDAASAASAVTALANAVATLGKAQAVVGKGENQLNYAVNLAQSQVSNEAAAESRIRDADLAAEAANLTKAQILMQAGVAALAQANSAPQQILSLLKG